MQDLTFEQNSFLLNQFLQSNFGSTKNKLVILVDGDRTLSLDDTSKLFNELVHIDRSHIKKYFESDGYVFSSFQQVSKIYSSIDKDLYLSICKQVADSSPLNYELIKFIQKLTEFNSLVIVVTSGITQIWKNIAENIPIRHLRVLGGIYLPFDNFIMGKDEKGMVVKFFKALNNKIISFGDSAVDSFMLSNSDIAVVIPNHKMNEDLLREVGTKENLFQFPLAQSRHPDIPIITEEIIFSLLEG